MIRWVSFSINLYAGHLIKQSNEFLSSVILMRIWLKNNLFGNLKRTYSIDDWVVVLWEISNVWIKQKKPKPITWFKCDNIRLRNPTSIALLFLERRAPLKSNYPSLNQYHWLCSERPIPERSCILLKQNKIKQK